MDAQDIIDGKDDGEERKKEMIKAKFLADFKERNNYESV